MEAKGSITGERKMTTDIQDRGQNLLEAFLALGMVAVMAYLVMYLLAASPVLVRAFGPLFGS